MSWSYLPHTAADRKAMLDAIGVKTAEELFEDVPAALRLKRSLALPSALPESELVKTLREVSQKNANVEEYVCFLGAGAYDHYIPSVVDHIVHRSEFYTAYTQYQPEIAQGYLQALWEYQSMICEITGMEVANASMYDGGTAAAEAAMLACGVLNRSEVLVGTTVSPYYRAVIETYAVDREYALKPIGYQDGTIDVSALAQELTKSTAAVIIQYPNFFGSVEEVAKICELVHSVGGYVVVIADPISLGLLESPGALGADIVVGEGQSLGLALSFGGPYLGFFAVREKLMRKMPGRIVGQTVDNKGRRGFVLTLQAREQHIRREKATSNICSNEALCALASSVYLAALGKMGFQEVASQCFNKAHYAYQSLTALTSCQGSFASPFFKEFVLRLDQPVTEVNKKLLAAGILGGLDLGQYYPELDQCMLLCVTEKRTKAEIDRLVTEMEAAL